MKQDKRRRKKKKKKKTWIVPLVLLIVLVGLLGGAYAVFARYYGLSNFMSDDDVSALAEAEVDAMVDDNGLAGDEEDVMRIEAEAATSDIVMPTDKDVYSILLIGVDRRDTSWSGNADSMILLTINNRKKTMQMTSFMRDLYADIPGKGVHKLNAACAYGGGPLLVQTIEENYKVKIDNYASVDFPSMIRIVDYAGGVTLTMSDEEVRVANDYIRVMCEEQKEDFSKHEIKSSGTMRCDGFQAVGYARNRYVGNSDYERTERQRSVMTQLIGNIRDMSASELNDFVEKILPLITHNVESATIVGMLPQMPSILEYALSTDRVPYDGMYTTKGEILYPDMKATIEKLHESLYGE